MEIANLSFNLPFLTCLNDKVNIEKYTAYIIELAISNNNYYKSGEEREDGYLVMQLLLLSSTFAYYLQGDSVEPPLPLPLLTLLL
jgi:hypothetical protein